MPNPPAPARPVARLRAQAGRALVAVAVLVALTPVAASAVPIEDFAGYQPQRHCSPTDKPGAVALLEWLKKRYPGTGSLGISRGCGVSGVSEHKEGRALDWAVSWSSARDRGYVADFLATVLAADADGNPAALARRMGIMYLIWNDHIYAAYRQFEKRPYTHTGCRSTKNCSETLRHRDHVHISLSRAGGQARTSWYHRGDADPTPPAMPAPPAPATAPTPPAADPAPPKQPTVPKGPPISDEIKLSRAKPYARVRVPLDGSTWKSSWRLRQGKKYKVTVAGLVGLGRPDQVADATCAWTPVAQAWASTPDPATASQHGALDVLVNGDPVFGSTCTDSHTYAATVVPTKSKPLRVKLAGTAVSGSLVLAVSRRGTDVAKALPTYPALTPAPTARTSTRGYGLLAETVPVPAAGEGIGTSQEVEAGARYHVTVSGTADLGGGVQTDGQCVAVSGQWYPQASLDPRYPGADHGNLYVNGVPFAGDSDCTTHTHVAELVPTLTGQLQLALWDPLGPSGNAGALTVTVQRLSGLGEPRQVKGEAPQQSEPWTTGRDYVPVAVDSPDGTVSTMRVRKDQRVTLVASGTYTSHGVTADATCVATPGGWVPRDPSLALDQDPLELWVDGELLPWSPVGAGSPCSDQHTYTTSYKADKSGPVRFAVLDLDHRDNAGDLAVTLVR